MRVLLYTVTGNLTLAIASLVFGTLGMLTGWIPPRGNVTFLCARWWGRCLLPASGVRPVVEREAELDPRQGYVFMANHQSMFDIPVLLATLTNQARFMAKRSLFQIPIFGWALAAGGFIPVDRTDRSRARETFALAVERLSAAGTSVLLFPEETRSRDGNLLPFKPGGFLLAIKSGLPIVPVGIHGTLEIQRKGSWWIRPRPVRVRYGRPIPTAGLGVRDKRELVGEVRRRIAELAGVGDGGDGAAVEDAGSGGDATVRSSE